MSEPGKSPSSSGTTGAIIFLVIAAVLFGAYWFASPYVTLYRVGQAVEDGDSDYICERINFEKLEDNFNKGALIEESPMLGGILDDGLGCETIKGMMEFIEFIQAFSDDDDEFMEELMEETSTGFDSPLTFSIRVGDEDDGQIRLVMSRTLVSWELTDVKFS